MKNKEKCDIIRKNKKGESYDKPIFLEPVYKDYIWGGTRLKTYLNKKPLLKKKRKVGKYL
jgi:hypothetical protein